LVPNVGRGARRRARGCNEGRVSLIDTDTNDELTDDRIEEIWEEAEVAALHAWGPGGRSKSNPYAPGTEEAEIWACAFRNAYARENGY
jgi:hypothetical protein